MSIALDPTLFEPGVPAKEGLIPLCVPELARNEWTYVKECLDTNWVSSAGPFVSRFEKKIAEYVGAPFGVATINGTAALHVALLVAGVEPEDEVLVSTLSFIAPANAIRYSGAWPVFIDAEPTYWQMDVEKVDLFLETECFFKDGILKNKKTGRRVRAILPVHILGHAVDMDPLLELAHKYNLSVIEDATESLGAKYKKKWVGNLGHVACFSFNSNKLITTGGGGMIVTNNEVWAKKARYLTAQAKDDPVAYVHHEIGYNYRMTNLQAALGCAQFEQIDHFIVAKRAIAKNYREAFEKKSGIIFMSESPDVDSVFWLSTILVDAVKYGMSSRELMQKLESRGIQTRPLWQTLHLSPAHRGSSSFECHEAQKIVRESLSLPSSVGLSQKNQQHVIAFL